jgi:hypothetical protein
MNCFIHSKSPVPIGEEARMASRDGIYAGEEKERKKIPV